MSIPSDQFQSVFDAHAERWRLQFRLSISGGDDDEMIHALYTRLVRAWLQGKLTETGQMVAYGNQAARFVIGDTLRAIRRESSLDVPLIWHAADSATPEAADRADWRRAFWATLAPVLVAEADRVAIKTLAADIPPAQVVSLFPSLFPDARSVYNARKKFKARVYARPEMLQTLRELWAVVA